MIRSFFRVILLGSLISVHTFSPSVALDLHAVNELPFSFEVVGIDDKQANGMHFSVVTIRLVNGSKYLNKVLIHCDANNRDGFSWSIHGQALNFTQNKTREFRIVSDGSAENPAYTSNATKVECRVAGFDSALF